jgi:hypothetical protein
MSIENRNDITGTQIALGANQKSRPPPLACPPSRQASQQSQSATLHKDAKITFMDLWTEHLMGAPLTARMPPGAANVDNFWGDQAAST